jgi:hypothetical protein
MRIWCHDACALNSNSVQINKRYPISSRNCCPAWRLFRYSLYHPHTYMLCATLYWSSHAYSGFSGTTSALGTRDSAFGGYIDIITCMLYDADSKIHGFIIIIFIKSRQWAKYTYTYHMIAPHFYWLRSAQMVHHAGTPSTAWLAWPYAGTSGSPSAHVWWHCRARRSSSTPPPLVGGYLGATRLSAHPLSLLNFALLILSCCSAIFS